MSQIVTELGLVTKLKFRLARHKTETEKQKLSLVQEIEGLFVHMYANMKHLHCIIMAMPLK